jgi:hypothetical protein
LAFFFPLLNSWARSEQASRKEQERYLIPGVCLSDGHERGAWMNHPRFTFFLYKESPRCCFRFVVVGSVAYQLMGLALGFLVIGKVVTTKVDRLYEKKGPKQAQFGLRHLLTLF